MSTDHVMYTGRHLEVSDRLTRTRVWTMDGKKYVFLSREEINSIRKALMVRRNNTFIYRTPGGLRVTIFKSRMNIGIVRERTGNGVLLMAGEFIDIYSHLNPLFAARKAEKSIVAGFFGALFVR